MNVFILGVARQGSHQLLVSSYMEKELKLLGILPTVLPVGDEAQLKAAIQKIMLMGGLILSPLTGNAAIDRLLSDQMAKACGVPLEMNESVFEQIAQRNVKLTREEVAQLATLPRGAEVYALQDNTYPAYQLDGENIHAILLPPDPVEQSAVFLNTVFPTFAQQKKYACESHILRVMDLSLSEVETALKDGLTSENPCIAVYPGKEEVIVRVSVRAQDPQQAASACQSAAKTVLEHLNGYVYGVDVPNIERALMQRLEKQGLHLSLCESGTNRRAEKRLVKCKKADSVELNFPQDAMSNPAVADIIKKYGAVSNQTAAAMAAAVSDSKHIGVGISLPTSREKAASAHVAASFSGHTLSKEIPISGFKSVQQLTDACVSHALNLARKFADSHPALPKGAAAATVAMAAAAGKKEDTTSMKNKAEGTPSLLKRFATAFFPQKADSTGEKMRKLGIILCLCVFCCSVGYLMNHHQQGVNAVETNKELSNMKEDFKNGKLDGYEIDEEKLAAVAPEVLDEYKPFVAINNDMQGWVEIEGTNLSYPVVQAKDNDYYHRLNFQEEYDYYGVPYLDYECKLEVDPAETSDNLIIYGHNIGNDGLMFNPLSYYKQLAFYKEHPVVRFDSIYKEQEYKIFGVMVLNAKPEQDNGKVFNYWQQVDFADEEAFNAYVNEVRKRSMWDIDVDVQPGDKLLTLSTCCYDFRPEARCVIVARAVRDGEDRTVDTSTAAQNADAYFPQAYYDALNEKAKYGHVKGIKIDGKAEYSIEVGQTLQLKAITDPADAPINTATWDSTAPAVATVDSKTGLVTAVAPGEVNITAMADDGGYAATVKVTVKAKNALEKLYLDQSEITLQPNQEALLTCIVEPEDAAVTLEWTHDGEDFITTTVNKSNQKQLYIKALAASENPITVTVKDTTTGKTDTCTVYVKQTSITGLQFQYNTYNLETSNTNGKQSAALTAIVLPEGATIPAETDVYWTVGDSNIIKLDSEWTGSSKAVSKVSNKVTALKAGQTTVTVSVEVNGQTYSATCNIVVAQSGVAVTGVTLNGNSTMEVGTTQDLQSVIVPEEASIKNYAWSSSDSSVASVDSYGTVTAVKAGSATITLTVTDSLGNKVSGSLAVEVKAAEVKCTVCGELNGKHRDTCSEAICPTCNQKRGDTHNNGCPALKCGACGGENGSHTDNCTEKICSTCGEKQGTTHANGCPTLKPAEPNYTCTTCQTTDGSHTNPACSEYRCGCGLTANDSGHTAGCTHYVAPTYKCETCQTNDDTHPNPSCPNYQPPQETVTTPTCTCNPVPVEGDPHAEGCPLAVAATSLDDELPEETTPSEETPSDPTETPTEE